MAAALAAVAAMAVSFFKLSASSFTPIQVRIWSVAFILTALVLGALDLWLADGVRTTADRPRQTVNGPYSVEGDVWIDQTRIENQTTIGTQVNIETLTITSADSAAERERKRLEAQRLLAQDVADVLRALRDREGFIAAALDDDAFDDDAFDDRMRAARERLAPARSESDDADYQRLIEAQRFPGLRHALNSRPLSSGFPTTLTATVFDAGGDPRTLSTFLAAIREVDHVTEALLDLLQRFDRRAPASDAEGAYRADHLAFQVALIRNRTEMAVLSASRLLGALDEEGIADVLEGLPADTARPSSAEAYARALEPLVAEAETLLDRRQDLVDRSTALRDEALDQYEALEDQLRIDEADGWSVVVGKARALRELGRIGEAAGAFARYGDMFAEVDPGARDYARTAQQFTQQIGQLGLEGGVYVFEVIEDGAAAAAGLSVGDIITSYAGKKTPGVVELSQHLHDAPAGQVVTIEYLRLRASGAFERRIARVPTGPLGAGLMPV